MASVSPRMSSRNGSPELCLIPQVAHCLFLWRGCVISYCLASAFSEVRLDCSVVDRNAMIEAVCDCLLSAA